MEKIETLYECIETFVIDLYDDDGYIVENNCMSVKKGTKWTLDKHSSRVIGGEVRLECVDRDSIYTWIEITKETFSTCFLRVI